MAAFIRKLLSRSIQNGTSFREFRKAKNSNIFTAVFGSAACFSSYLVYKRYFANIPILQLSLIGVVCAKEKDEGEKPDKSKHTINYREMRFRQFASCEHDNQIYMTPQDFLESVTEENPRARIGRHRLTPGDMTSVLKTTPVLKKGSDRLFRNIFDKGIISYTEYLFLLCVLTKPQSGFLIAFNMFDTDGNKIVDKKEFLVLEHFFTLPPKERKFVPRDPDRTKRLSHLQKVFQNNRNPTKDEEGADGKVLETELPDTTLLVHFFGKNGKNVLKYQDFHRFMENLQSEVIELEFNEFSKGLNTISELEFARILLRYTNLDQGDVEECLERVKERMPSEKGINFAEFKKFCQFLNNLDDFAIAMKMYTFAQQPVNSDEFNRAVFVCTGFNLSSHIVSTVFNIFDKDGDGHLSHHEFISVMKDRLHRGARSHLMHNQNTWDTFKSCVKNEMRTF